MTYYDKVILMSLNLIKVLAHELGHTLGMSHDFDEKHGGENGTCNGNGIMSYGSFNKSQWSLCSRLDFEQHYASRKWESGCLDDISGIIRDFPNTFFN